MEEITGTGYQDMTPPENNLSGADRWLLRVRGQVQVEIVDEQGRRIGPYLEREEEGQRIGWPRRKHEEEEEAEEARRTRQKQGLPSLFDISIPGASYNSGQSYTSAFLTQPGIYTCRFHGQSPSAVDIYFTGFNANTRLNTIFFQGIPISERGFAQYVYNTFDPPATPVLTLEDEGQRQDFTPTAILNPSESQDIIPPQTTISIEGGMVNLTAIDNPGGPGVWRTYYTTDGRTFSVYTEPFPLPAEAQIVMAFSIDRNGNREYPGAVLPVLGLSATHLVFTAAQAEPKIAAQVIYILNLDPIPVTGPLDWVASTDVPWLTVEKREGKTPDLLTLSVKSGNVEPGTYTAHVTVRSPTPRVVYAERVVSVVLEVRAGPARLER